MRIEVMNAEEEVEVQCPYCSEVITVLVDCSVPQQTYIEDCQVCCRPITFHTNVSESEELAVSVAHENE